ncbi:HK97-gp10 family putative phage morphogenesis protein [Arthrobacter sp. B3I4]|uniref:HK97-gp10 family putative phage morphogenesis protein n=1 Tax=Arthrobacter sp. B3I4 TaxID=3042267 RepID=UPI00278154B4|nr:HK97-gp10 family putative phage morphogenesis protein [Arthrobacter sp. B3I4]MDQ0756077.1 HK97 gp10 family phage protein [Arthrobacter sp. B3I4]
MGDGAEALRKLSADIAKAAATTEARAQVVVRKTAYDIERTAKNLVPVDTGNLKGSIGHSDARSVGRSGTLAIEIGPTANYGVFVEQGTSRMAPQPFMGPAADTHEPAFTQAMQQLGLEGLNG